MATTTLLPRKPSAEKLARARHAAVRASRLQGEQLSGHQIDVLPGLADLLPTGGLQAGATYSVTGSTALLAGLLAAPSSAGLWCGLVGLPDFAAEAARDLGCDLERLVMVPDPGLDWVNVLAALVDALPVVVTRPVGTVTHSEASRLAARLRKREGVLVVAGRWPRSESEPECERPRVAGASVPATVAWPPSDCRSTSKGEAALRTETARPHQRGLAARPRRRDPGGAHRAGAPSLTASRSRRRAER